MIGIREKSSPRMMFGAFKKVEGTVGTPRPRKRIQAAKNKVRDKKAMEALKENWEFTPSGSASRRSKKEINRKIEPVKPVKARLLSDLNVLIIPLPLLRFGCRT
jgi:hypothetical protein